MLGKGRAFQEEGAAYIKVRKPSGRRGVTDVAGNEVMGIGVRPCEPVEFCSGRMGWFLS